MTTRQTPRPSRLALRAFALPRGLLGRLGGQVMARGNEAAQREVLGLLDVRPGERVLEVGYGPGVLLRLLAEETPAGAVVGVDPSPVMRRMASRRCAAAVASGRVDPRSGSATDTGVGDGSFDHVVSVNNVPFWGDIPAGFAELHRVLRPGGTAVVAFHSGAGGSRRARRIGLPEEAAVRLRAAMAAVFGDAGRRDLTHLVAFRATRHEG